MEYEGYERYEDEYGIYYFKDGILHREDGPAIEHCDGDKWWYKEGKLHRLDGPAMEYNNGKKEWWIEDKKIECSSQEEFEKKIGIYSEKNTSCSKCNGTGKLDFEFYSRECECILNK